MMHRIHFFIYLSVVWPWARTQPLSARNAGNNTNFLDIGSHVYKSHERIVIIAALSLFEIQCWQYVRHFWQYLQINVYKTFTLLTGWINYLWDLQSCGHWQHQNSSGGGWPLILDSPIYYTNRKFPCLTHISRIIHTLNSYNLILGPNFGEF